MAPWLLPFVKAIIAFDIKLLPAALHLLGAAINSPTLITDLKAFQADPTKGAAIAVDVAALLGIPLTLPPLPGTTTTA